MRSGLRKGFRASREMTAADARELDDIVRDHGERIEDLSVGRIAAHPQHTAAPTGGTWKRGDFVRNTEPSEAGTAGGKYVTLGWSCVLGGTPGTWVPCRALTGN
jgi:hypothetical protein